MACRHWWIACRHLAAAAMVACSAILGFSTLRMLPAWCVPPVRPAVAPDAQQHARRAAGALEGGIRHAARQCSRHGSVTGQEWAAATPLQLGPAVAWTSFGVAFSEQWQALSGWISQGHWCCSGGDEAGPCGRVASQLGCSVGRQGWLARHSFGNAAQVAGCMCMCSRPLPCRGCDIQCSVKGRLWWDRFGFTGLRCFP